MWIRFIPREDKPYVEKQLVQLASTPGADQAEYKRASDVWYRYEEDNAHFKWGVDVNLYLYSSLKSLAIILSAVTPALIVAPSLKDKKVLVALPAVIVAVATGLIGEFDFKNEAARFDAAKVQLQTEKSMFITGDVPFYFVQPLTSSLTSPGQTKSATAKASPPVADLSLVSDPTDVPFLPPHNYSEALANFAYRVEKIRQAVASERDQFLRGKTQQSSASEAKPATVQSQSSRTRTANAPVTGKPH